MLPRQHQESPIVLSRLLCCPDYTRNLRLCCLVAPQGPETIHAILTSCRCSGTPTSSVAELCKENQQIFRPCMPKTPQASQTSRLGTRTSRTSCGTWVSIANMLRHRHCPRTRKNIPNTIVYMCRQLPWDPQEELKTDNTNRRAKSPPSISSQNVWCPMFDGSQKPTTPQNGTTKCLVSAPLARNLGDFFGLFTISTVKPCRVVVG